MWIMQYCVCARAWNWSHNVKMALNAFHMRVLQFCRKITTNKPKTMQWDGGVHIQCVTLKLSLIPASNGDICGKRLNPCGEDAVCNQTNTNAICHCKPGFQRNLRSRKCEGTIRLFTVNLLCFSQLFLKGGVCKVTFVISAPLVELVLSLFSHSECTVYAHRRPESSCPEYS